MNAFTTEFWIEYGKLLDSLIHDGYDIRAVVLSSVLPKVFTAGIDCTYFPQPYDIHIHEPDSAVTDFDNGSLGSGEDSARMAFQTRKIIDEFHRIVTAPQRAPFPVITALHGHVIGLGVDLIAACDIRYAASNTSFSIKVCSRDIFVLSTSSSIFWQEIDIGVAPHIGTLAFLPKITGNDSLVRELTYTARPFSAIEAEKLGLVSKVVEGGRDEVIKAALELAKLIATKSPVAVASSKHLISHSRDHSVPENLSYTSVWNSSSLMTKVTFSPSFTVWLPHVNMHL